MVKCKYMAHGEDLMYEANFVPEYSVVCVLGGLDYFLSMNLTFGKSDTIR